MKYSTQMEAAKHGFVTEEMKIVAEKENVSCDYLLEKIACGEIVIPKKQKSQINFARRYWNWT